ncbi:GNAT family N-acetyltransferase [Marinobacter sp. 1Y8]
MKVRKARLTDAKAISALAVELGYNASEADMIFRLTHLLPDPDQFVAVAERSDQTLAGWIAAERRLSLESGEKAEIIGLVVSSRARRTGAGRALVNATQEWAKTRKLNHLCVRSNVARTEAHQFYPALGFSHDKTQHVYGISLGN